MTSDSIPPPLVAPSGTHTPSQTPNHGHGPGRVIRMAREHARLSLEELATQTKLARATLEALERDDFEALNEPVYVRGYYRKCAKVLALSEAELIAAYEKLVVPKAPQAPTKLLLGSGPPMGRPTLRRRGLPLRPLAVVLIAALAATAVWVYSNRAAVTALQSTTVPAVPAPPPAAPVTVGEPGATAPAESSAPAPAPAPALTSPSPNAAAATPHLPVGAPTTTAAPAVAAPPPSAAPEAGIAAPVVAEPGPVAESGATPGPVSGVLTVSFRSTSWIRIEDADGKLLLSGVYQGGDRQQVHGHPPYALFIGNAPGVVIDYDGKPVELSAFVKSNSTARLTVP